METKRTRVTRRFLGATVSALLLTGIAAAPVALARGAGTTTSLGPNPATCQFTVTVSWQGFGGKVTPEVGLVRQGSGGLDVGVAYSDGAAMSGRNGSYSHTFVLTANGLDQGMYTAVGRLLNGKGGEISGSPSTPGGYVSGGTCGIAVVS